MPIPPALADMSEALLLHQEFSTRGVNRKALEEYFSLPPLPLSIQEEQRLLLEIQQRNWPEEKFLLQLRGASLWMESLFEKAEDHLSSLLLERSPLIFIHRLHLKGNSLYGEGIHRVAQSFFCFDDGLSWTGDQETGLFSFSFPIETLPYDAEHSLSFLRGVENPSLVSFPIPNHILPIAYDHTLLLPQIFAYLREKISRIL